MGGVNTVCEIVDDSTCFITSGLTIQLDSYEVKTCEIMIHDLSLFLKRKNILVILSEVLDNSTRFIAIRLLQSRIVSPEDFSR